MTRGHRIGNSRTLDRRPESLQRAWQAAVDFGRYYPVGAEARTNLLAADWGPGKLVREPRGGSR